LSGLAVCLVVVAYLSACTTPDQPANVPTTPYAPRPAQFAIPELQEAAYFYKGYYALAPGDLLGLKRLAEVCAALEDAGVEDESCREAALWASGSKFKVESESSDLQPEAPPAAVLEEALKARTDDPRIAAELLGVSVEDLKLGPDLVENGEFEEWVGGRPSGWVWWTMFNREPYDAGAFAAGGDGLPPFEGRRTVRVDGFWVQQQEDKSPARAGFWQWDEMERVLRPITLGTDGPYVFSFHYRTMRVPEREAKVWVSNDPDVLWAGYHGLPATDGAWRHFVAVGWNHADGEAAICPLVSSFAPGSVEFDNVQVRPVGLLVETAVEAGEVQFWVIEGSD
jgi:hypothetical protein